MPLFNLTKKSRNLINPLKKKMAEEIYSIEKFKSIIEAERARANRNNHNLSLLFFDMDSSGQEDNTTVHLIRIIKHRIRCVDKVGWYDNQRIGVILPYTSKKGATQLAENICESLNQTVHKPVCTVYTYPNDKLNLN